MAGAAGIADIWRQRSGVGQDLSLDLRKAIHGINPMYKFMPTINGYPYQLPYFIGNPMGFDLYQTKDGRFFLPTGAYPGLMNDMCTFLGCAPDKNSIAKAVSKWDAMELDEAAADKELVFAMVRTAEEWAGSPPSGQAARRKAVGGNRQDRRQRSRAVHTGGTPAVGVAGAVGDPRHRRQRYVAHVGRARRRGAADRPPRRV
jgi:hypothetical protein